jgi:hypothetical protein
MSFYDTTNKCSALRSWSNPVPLSLEVGRGPVNWLSARSSQVTLESLPNEGGMLPVSLFEFTALCKSNKNREIINILLIYFTVLATVNRKNNTLTRI